MYHNPLYYGLHSNLILNFRNNNTNRDQNYTCHVICGKCGLNHKIMDSFKLHTEPEKLGVRIQRKLWHNGFIQSQYTRNADIIFVSKSKVRIEIDIHN